MGPGGEGKLVEAFISQQVVPGSLLAVHSLIVVCVLIFLLFSFSFDVFHIDNLFLPICHPFILCSGS